MIRRCKDASLVKFIFIYFDVISISKKKPLFKKMKFYKDFKSLQKYFSLSNWVSFPHFHHFLSLDYWIATFSLSSAFSYPPLLYKFITYIINLMHPSSIFVIFSKYHYWLERQKIFIGYHNTNTSWLNSKDFEQHNSNKKYFDDLIFSSGQPRLLGFSYLFFWMTFNIFCFYTLQQINISLTRSSFEMFVCNHTFIKGI